MNKVVIEITEDGWETTVYANGKIYTQRWRRCTCGCESINQPFENYDLPENLQDALDDIDMFEVMDGIAAIDEDN